MDARVNPAHDKFCSDSLLCVSVPLWFPYFAACGTTRPKLSATARAAAAPVM
jgi:hypothetical protein